MKIGGKEILAIEFKPRGVVESQLGKLSVFDISGGDMDRVRKECGGSFKSAKPQELARRFVPLIAHLEKDLGANGTKPKGATLSEDQVKGLNGDTVEAVLQIFIGSQHYLNRKLARTTSTNEAGQKVESWGYGEIIHPRKEGESNADYLQRLLALDEEKRLAEFKQMTAQFDKMIAPAHFSDTLVKQISSTLEMGASLTKALDASRSVDFRHFSPPEWTGQPRVVAEPVLPSVDFAAIAANAAEARWAPFNSLAERLDKLVATTLQSQEFMVQMNQTQTQIAAEIKASSEGANIIGEASLQVANATFDVTRKGFWLTVIVVLLTVAGLVFSAASWRTAANAPTQDNRANDVVQGLDDVKRAVVDGKQSSDANITAILNELTTAHSQQAIKLQAIVDANTQQVNQQAADQKTIDELRKQITRLEDELRRLEKQIDPKKDAK